MCLVFFALAFRVTDACLQCIKLTGKLCLLGIDSLTLQTDLIQIILIL